MATNVHLDKSSPLVINGSHCVKLLNHMVKCILNLTCGDPLSLVEELLKEFGPLLIALIQYFFDTYKHIFCDLHTNLEQGCNESVIPPNASRDFIVSIMCPRHGGKKYYGKSCLYGNCSRCSGFSLLNRCIHGIDEHQFGNMSMEMQSFKYITCQLYSVKESKKISLVKSKMKMIIACFSSYMFSFYIYIL